MAVSVEHGSMRIDSMSDDAAAVSASLASLDEASTVSPPAEPAATGVEQPETVESAPETPDPADERNTDGTFKKGNKGPKARINELTWEREEARRERDAEKNARVALEARLAALEQAQPAKVETPAAAAPPPAPSDKPTLKQFTESGDYATYEDAHEAYLEARDAWRDGQKAKEAEEREWQASAKTTAETFNARQKDFAARTPDYQSVMAVTATRISDVMAYAMMTAERGPELLYLLAKHPEEATRIGERTKDFALDAAPVVLDLLEAKFPPVKGASTGPSSAASRVSVPAPISPVGAGPVVSETSPDSLPFGKAYIDAQNRREMERHKAKYGQR